MLIYHPAFDVNHCLYRALLVLEARDDHRLEWDIFKLIDFYLLFPQLLKKINPLPTQFRPFKKILEQIPDAYEGIPNPKRILFELEAIQRAATTNLAAKGLIDVDALKDNSVVRTSRELPHALQQLLLHDEFKQQDWFSFLVRELPAMDLLGKSGLKARSGLLEYRYDLS